MRLQLLFGTLALMALAMPSAAQTPKTFEGTFRGLSPDADQQMVITREGDEYMVRIRVKQGRCAGAVDASGTPKAHMMSVRSGACTLNMVRAGPNVQVEEDAGCEQLRGPECSFTNVYAPR